jgi:hypothetical protein
MENPKNDYNCRMAPARQEMCMEHYHDIVVELSNGDVNSGSRHLEVAEIGKPPLKTNEKMQKKL